MDGERTEEPRCNCNCGRFEVHRPHCIRWAWVLERMSAIHRRKTSETIQ